MKSKKSPPALSALKYFQENAPQYQIIAAGSLLGIALHQNNSFPVGKVDFLDLFPLSFSEFLSALNQDKYLTLLQEQKYDLLEIAHEDLLNLLRIYFLIGGMPEPVASFSHQHDFNLVRQIQNQILLAYDHDFSKHAPLPLVPKIRALWESIPAQLSKENKKFFYGLIKTGARAKDYELALAWLIDAGLIHRLNRIKKIAYPLKFFEDQSAFKLFFLDIGLLSAKVNLDSRVILDGNTIFDQFKGALAEQFVMQQLIPDLTASVSFRIFPGRSDFSDPLRGS